MGKNTLFTGQPLFNQLLSLIPKDEISQVVHKYSANRYYKKFFFNDHLIAMLFCAFHKCTGIREVITGMQAQGDRLLHLGLKNSPRRSTLADSNTNRSSKIFEDLFHGLVKHFLKNIPDSRQKNDISRLFIIDSTTITLFDNVMKGTGLAGHNGRRKGGAKAHVVMDADHNSPEFVRITEARMADNSFLNQVYIPPNSYVVMDKGYNHYSIYREWSKKNIRWYTRMNKSSAYQIMEEQPLSKEQAELGIKDDLIIKLGSPARRKRIPLQDARLVKYKDKQTGKVFEFLTNDFNSTPFEIAEMYRRRWKIETFFKRLKQNFPLKYFLGDSENAIRIQIWCSLIADLLIKVVLDKTAKFYRKWSFANLSSFIKIHLGTYINLFEFLKNPEKALLRYKPPENYIQTKLFTGPYF